MKYFSMFSGIGGFELGIEQAAQELGLTTECVGYSEIDKHAIRTYEEHFNHDNYGDATTINADALPEFDSLVAGFPCQAFSIAGGRKGFDEARGTLFFDIARQNWSTGGTLWSDKAASAPSSAATAGDAPPPTLAY